MSLPTVTLAATVTATSTADLSAALPPALQVQLSTIMVQFLQHAASNATPPGTPSPSTIQPVNPPVTLPLAPQAQLASLPSLTAQFPQHTANNLSPVPLINAPSQQPPAPLSSQQVLSSQPTLRNQPMLPSQLPLTSQPPLPSQLPLMTATTTIPVVGSYLPVVQPTATHAAEFVPPQVTRTTIRTIAQPAGYLMETQPSYQMISNTIPPVPAQIRQRITQGEFIDFAVLLHKATFPDAAIDPSAVAQQSVKKISSFAIWMQAWNTSPSNPLPQPDKRLRNDILPKLNLLYQCTPTTAKLVAV